MVWFWYDVMAVMFSSKQEELETWMFRLYNKASLLFNNNNKKRLEIETGRKQQQRTTTKNTTTKKVWDWSQNEWSFCFVMMKWTSSWRERENIQVCVQEGKIQLSMIRCSCDFGGFGWGQITKIYIVFIIKYYNRTRCTSALACFGWLGGVCRCVCVCSLVESQSWWWSAHWQCSQWFPTTKNEMSYEDVD